MKKLSFVIPTINRFEYLETCLNSLKSTIKPDNVFIHLTIIDDNSDDKNVIEFIEKYLPNFADKIDKVYKTERTLGLCETNLKEIWSKHYSQGYELFCNMDPDAIVNKNWLIHIIELYNMVYSLGSKMSRHQTSICNRPTCGGPKKGGLGPSVGWFMSSNPSLRGAQQSVPKFCVISKTIQTQRYGYSATHGGNMG